ncbi:Rieske (2Fe-2S) protein [Streptomyces sp. SAJ15]|uniref:Rieske (2Fe-2S) protein n=1 Tax=Streptomyces sp. SAJ15 TaxID=2011095 RepID=UPI001185865E|nr:Rieske (2Fe-2S) protein [Streptomyces sp. SAJ15]TVL89847.1 Rieske (2Fe-2S) protein [Streptomyces sp. SAJ15]
MTDSPRIGRIATRRAVVTAVGAAGLAAALTACGDDGGSDGGDSYGGGTDTTRETGGEQPAASGGSTGGGGAELARTGDIPEGGGMIFKDEKVVVTQPTAGEFKAFSAVCTHQGCAVGDVSGGTINCPCHKSSFDIADGSVKGGPAPRPLPEARITVKGESITLA